MALKKSEKKFISKNIRKLSIEQIAQELDLSESLVIDYAKTRWDKNRLDKMIHSRDVKVNNVENTSITNFKYQMIVSVGILCLIVLIVYFNSLNNVFLSDDFGILQDKNIGTIQSVISQPFSFIRPIFYAIAFHLGGLNPMSFRLINIILHMGVVSMIFILLTRLKNIKLAFLTALIVAVHPIFIESVSWISGGGYVQYSFFFLLSLYFYIRSENNLKMLLLSYLMYFLSLESSITAVSLALMYPIFEISFRSFKKNWLKIVPFFIIALIFATTIFTGGLQSRQSQLDASYVQNEKNNSSILVSAPYAVANYLHLIFWPDKLTLYHSEIGISVASYTISILVAIASILILSYFAYKNKYNFFWFALFFVSLAPSILSRGVAWIVAERYVYLGSIGVIAVAIYYFDEATNNKRLKTISAVFLILVVIALSIRTIARNIDWQNEDNLWIATGKASPSDPKTHNNLGDVYGRRGDLKRSAQEFQTAIELNPKYADAYHNLANTYVQMGKIDEAITLFKKAAELKPILWQSHQNLASIYFSKKDYKNAQDEINKAIKINAQSSNLYNNLATIYIETGDITHARLALAQSLKLDPQNKYALEMMSKIENAK